MRKLLLVCLTLLLHLTATAQDWTVNNNKYPNKTTVYMKIDGLVIGHSYDVGAFIDGVCRGITTNSVFVNQDGTTGCFGMDLWGTAADRGKTITFKVRKVRRVGATSPSNTVYTINKTLSYTGSQQGSPDNGIAFNIILPVNISLPIPIEIGVGEKTPLRPLIKVTPANATLPDVLEWDFSNFSSYINVTNDILTGMSQAREAYLGLHAGNLSTYSFVRVIQRIKSIKVRPGKETITVAPRDVNRLASELHNAFIIEPENHEEYVEYVSSNPSVVQVDANNYCHPIETGTAIVTAIVYNRDGSPRLQASVKVKVGVPAQRIEINYPTAFYANAGDDIYPRLKAVTKVLPDNATSKQLAWTCNNPNVEVKTANGEVKAIVVKKAGRYMLNATLNDEYNQTGQQLSASIPASVENPVKDIAIKGDMNFTFTTLNNNPIDIKPNVSLVPADGDPISVSFTSGGRSVVGTGLWDAQGMRANFVAKAYGQDVITANVTYSDYTNYLGTGNVPHRTVTRTFKVNINKAQTLITTIKVRPGKETIIVAPRDDNKLASELHNAFIIEPANHTEQVRYTSSNPLVVQVDANNSCIPLQVGTSTVTAIVYNSDGSPRLQASVKVKVGVPAQRVEINYPTAFYANAGDDIYPRLKAVTKVLPDNATSKKLAWTSNNPNVEIKTANGEVKAIMVKKAGRYALNATLNDEYNQTGQQLSASIPINVQNPVKDIAIKGDMNFTFTTLNNNPIDIKPNVSLVPADGDPISVSFTSGGRSIVGTGLWDAQGMRADFVAKAYGQDVITANVTYSDYTNYLGTGNVPHRTVTRTFKVNINKAQTLITTIKVRPGKETIIVAPRDDNKLASELHNAFIIEPANHTEQVRYTSSNPSVVQVDANNSCIPLQVGTATVTAIVYNSDGSPRLQASVKVKVGVPAQRIEINYPTTFYANAGDDIYPRLKAVTKVLPDNATSKQLAWTCNNPNVEVKTANGEVKAIVVKKAGRYMLNATLNDEYNQTGQQLSASIPINVQNPVKDIAIKGDMNFTFTTLNNNPIDIKPNVSLVPADGDPISVSFTSGGRSVVGTGLWDAQGMRANFVAKAYGQDVITANVTYSDYTNYLGRGNVPQRTVTRTFKVNIRQGALNISVTCEPLVVGREAQVTLTAQPAGTQLDLTKVNVTLTATGGQYPTSWPLCEVRHTSNKVSVTPKLPGAVVRKVFYEGLEVSSDNDNVAMPVSFARGWQWRTFCGTVAPTNFNAVLGTHVEEIRAQESLLRYDSQQGFFGQIAEEGIKAQTCYMVKTADNYAPLPNAKLDNTLTDSRTAYTQELSQGWNWIGNPYFFDRALNNVLRHAPNFTIVKGDRIVSKNNGFAEYDGTRWRGTLAVLKAGEGLLYYSQDFKTLTWQAESTMPAINATAGAKYNAEQEEPQWAYDHTLFENNASIVASLTNGNPHADYRIGAFVGNECRGEGRAIDGKLFITAHSKTGETIRFVLFDTRTGTLYNVSQTTLARPLVGGLTNPLPLSLGAGTTGVGSVYCDDANAEVFNLQGQRIAKPQQGVNIIRDKNGKTRKEMKR